MSGVLGAVRPDEWNFPLFLHVLGAMIFVGAVLTGVGTLAFARGDVRFLRLGYWTLLVVALPAYVLLRVGGEWIYSREGWDEEGVPSPAWLDIGFVVANVGAVLLVVALIVGGIGMSRLRDGRGEGLLRATMFIALLILLAALVAAWAMAGKPD
jgi:ABC-type maltose transport system permease subunit